MAKYSEVKEWTTARTLRGTWSGSDWYGGTHGGGHFIKRADNKILVTYSNGKDIMLSVVDSEDDIFYDDNKAAENEWLVYTTVGNVTSLGVYAHSSLIRLEDGKILLFIIEQGVEESSDVPCKVMCYKSNNGLGTDFAYVTDVYNFSLENYTDVSGKSGTAVGIPIQLETGRILIPISVAMHDSADYAKMGLYVAYSDDDGDNWLIILVSDYRHNEDLRGIAVFDDGDTRQLVVARSHTYASGKLYFHVSTNDGESWTQLDGFSDNAAIYSFLMWGSGDGYNYFLYAEYPSDEYWIYRRPDNELLPTTGQDPYDLENTWEGPLNPTRFGDDGYERFWVSDAGHLTLCGTSRGGGYSISYLYGGIREELEPTIELSWKYDKIRHIWIYDPQFELKAVLSNANPKACPFVDDAHIEDLNGRLTYEFSVPADHDSAQYIEPEGHVLLPDLDGKLVLFTIRTVEEENRGGKLYKYVYAENAVLELLGHIIRPTEMLGTTAKLALEAFLTGSRWQAGQVDYAGIKDVIIEDYITAQAAVQKLREIFGLEFRFRVDLSGGKIINRWVDMLKRRGEDTGKRFEYAKDIVGLRKTSDSSQLVTALIGLGAVDEEGNQITFENVEWSTATGDPVDKPLGQDWVGDREALNRWGVDGKHITNVYNNPDIEDPEELLQATWEELQKRVMPRESYEIDVALLARLLDREHEAVRLGDECWVIDWSFNPPITLKVRVVELTRSYSDPTKDKAVLGEITQYYTATVQADRENMENYVKTYVNRQLVTFDPGASSFLDLEDTPSTYEGQQGKFPRVNSTQDALEFVSVEPGSGADNFLDLTDTPGSYSGQQGKVPAVNSGENALEFVDPGGGAENFTELSDTPASYTDQGGKLVAVKDNEQGLKFVENQDHGILGAYDIEVGSYIDAGMSDEFNSTSLDPKWTAVGMSSGTVDLLRIASGNIYDLSTRPGALLIQAASHGDLAMLRQDVVPANGEQIIVSLTAPFPTDIMNNAWRAVIALNDTDSDYDTGDYIYLYIDGTDNSKIKLWDGTLVGEIYDVGHAKRLYFRLVRSSDTAYFFASVDGISWTFVGSKAWSTWDNFWVGITSPESFSGPQPIAAINWVRHVANTNLDPW